MNFRITVLRKISFKPKSKVLGLERRLSKLERVIRLNEKRALRLEKLERKRYSLKIKLAESQSLLLKKETEINHLWVEYVEYFESIKSLIPYSYMLE